MRVVAIHSSSIYIGRRWVEEDALPAVQGCGTERLKTHARFRETVVRTYIMSSHKRVFSHILFSRRVVGLLASSKKIPVAKPQPLFSALLFPALVPRKKKPSR